MVDTGLTEHNMCSHWTTVTSHDDENLLTFHGGCIKRNTGRYPFNAVASESNKKKSLIYKVVFNDPATIILWEDGTKTVVKCNDGYFDPEKGMAMAIAKKYLGNKGNYYNEFVKWLPAHCLEESDDELFVDILKQLLN